MRYDFTTILDREGKDASRRWMSWENAGFAQKRPKDGFNILQCGLRI